MFSLTGCLGLTGMNASRVAIAINNLYSTDATLGVVWPALVRRALQCTNALAARDLILRAPIGSGHQDDRPSGAVPVQRQWEDPQLTVDPFHLGAARST